MRCRSHLAGLVALVALGCGGNEFQSNGAEAGAGGTGPTGGAGVGGSEPTGGSAGKGGNGGMPPGGSGGASGSGPTGGTAGMPTCVCPATQYCRGGECLDCAELSTLDFGPAELLLDDPTTSLRFPRTGNEPGSLFYRAGDDGSGRIFYTPNATALGAFVGDPAIPEQSGALFVGDLDPDFNVIFDQTTLDPAGDVERHARSAAWNGAMLGSVMEMPSPLGPDDFEDYSVAAATLLGRVFWMNTRDGPPRIRTGLIGTGNDDILSIDIPTRTGSGTCPLDVSDATPWVTPDGRRMFLRAPARDADCGLLDAGATDLFVVPLEPMSGIPVQPALSLASLNVVGSTDTDPSLSPNFCEIYFASDRDSSGPSNFKLYRAVRR